MSERIATIPAKRFGTAEEFGAVLRIPVLDPRRLHHRARTC